MDVMTWFRSLRQKPEPESADNIRARRCNLQQQRTATVHRRDSLALDAMNDEGVAARWNVLDKEIGDLDRQLAVLAGALPIAAAREAEAAANAGEAARRAFEQKAAERTADAQKFLDELLARLPTGEELTRLRDLRDELGSDAAAMRAWSNAVHVRRPLDPLHTISAAMQWRNDRISRSRWIGRHPITLDRKDGTNG